VRNLWPKWGIRMAGSKRSQKLLLPKEGSTGHGVWICRKGGTVGDGKTKLGGHNGQ
jgi:hypothetical protein